MRQYGDLPMDLGDASLLWVAQAQGLRRIATLDRRDFGTTDSRVESGSITCWIHEHPVAGC